MAHRPHGQMDALRCVFPEHLPSVIRRHRSSHFKPTQLSFTAEQTQMWGGLLTVTASSLPRLSRGLKNEEHPKPKIKQRVNHTLENVTTWLKRKKQKQSKAGRDSGGEGP